VESDKDYVGKLKRLVIPKHRESKEGFEWQRDWRFTNVRYVETS